MRTTISLALLASAACTTTELPSGDAVPLKAAKLNIEHNATDNDTGFQGFIDSEGWSRLDVTGPDGGTVLSFAGRGALRELGVTELFFETVEPANVDVPLEEMLAKLPEGEYTIEGPTMEDGESLGPTRGTALLTHDIPEGPRLVFPTEGQRIPVGDTTIKWGAVTKTIAGKPITLKAYQLIIEKNVEPDPHMIGKYGLQMYLTPTTTEITVAGAFFEPGTSYLWEVLAIEPSGNQTLSSGTFSTM